MFMITKCGRPRHLQLSQPCLLHFRRQRPLHLRLYSSLTYLQRLPAQIVKIDQSFVRDMLDNERDRTLVRGIVSLARAFQRQVVAEGVETLAHAAALRDMGCDTLQGYGIARPMPLQDLIRWVKNWQPPPELRRLDRKSTRLNS